MTRRSTTYFDVGGTTYGPVSAKYLGGDGFGEGNPGTKYNVFVYNSQKLEAPNPPFNTEEGPSITSKQLVKAIEHLLAHIGKKPKPKSKAKPSLRSNKKLAGKSTNSKKAPVKKGKSKNKQP